MFESLLNVLETRFTPERITLHIELVPGDAASFELPIEEAGKKLSMVANYAASTFGVRVAPVVQNGVIVTSDVLDANIRKEVEKGNSRAVTVFEGELARARASKNPIAVLKAEQNLANVKDRIARTTPPGVTP